MEANPYQSPGAEEAAPRSGIRSYHVPFLIAAVCIPLVVAACTLSELPESWRAVIFTVAGVMLVYALPVCLLVIWEWIRTGEMPALNLEPLVACAERRALYQAWRERPQLDDDTFYQTYYATSGIACETVCGVRREMELILGMSLAGVHPSDDMGLAEPELDFADVFFRFDRVFEIEIPWRTTELEIDGSFDSLVRLVAAARPGIGTCNQ